MYPRSETARTSSGARPRDLNVLLMKLSFFLRVYTNERTGRISRVNLAVEPHAFRCFRTPTKRDISSKGIFEKEWLRSGV